MKHENAFFVDYKASLIDSRCSDLTEPEDLLNCLINLVIISDCIQHFKDTCGLNKQLKLSEILIRLEQIIACLIRGRVKKLWFPGC